MVKVILRSFQDREITTIPTQPYCYFEQVLETAVTADGIVCIVTLMLLQRDNVIEQNYGIG